MNDHDQQDYQHDQEGDDGDQQEQDVEEEDAPKNSGKSAGRLNAIVNAATFLCNADVNYTDKMVEIVKKEFSDYSGYVSMLPHKKNAEIRKQLSILITQFHFIHVLDQLLDVSLGQLQTLSIITYTVQHVIFYFSHLKRCFILIIKCYHFGDVSTHKQHIILVNTFQVIGRFECYYCVG